MVVVFTEPLINLFEVFDLSCARVSAGPIRNKLHAWFLDLDRRKAGSLSFLDSFLDLIVLFLYSLFFFLEVRLTAREFSLEAEVEMSKTFPLPFALVIERFAEPADVCSIGNTAAILFVNGNLLGSALEWFEHLEI